MPAYDRYWDVLVTSGSFFDFSDEIITACAYQRETKRNNNVLGNTLIAIPVISKAGAVAAACLNQIKSCEVLFADSSTFFTVGRELSGALVNKAIQVNAANARSVIELFTKRLPLFGFKLSESAPGLEKILLTAAESGKISLARYPLSENNHTLAIYGSSYGNFWLDALKSDDEPPFGYICTAHTMADISQRKIESLTMSVVDWIGSGGAAKIRFTCHGDGEGNLEMVSNGKCDAISADSLALWLCANGLTSSKNLKVISLNLCMAAKHNLTPAVIKNGQYSPAEGSAVELVARTLGSRNVKGVKVTGSNENVALIDESRFLKMNPEDEDKLRMGLSIEKHKLRVGDNVRMISIPSGFPFDAASKTLTVPAGWTVDRKDVAGSQLFAIKCPPGSSVQKATTKIVRPRELATGDFTFKSPGHQDVSFNSQGWIYNGTEMLSSEGWTLSGPQKIRFTGTGGTVQVEGGSGADGSATIYERLSKSRAKAVAIS